MDYAQALDFIHGIAKFSSKPGLLRIGMLLERMGNPQDGLKFIHVAGTNGKGSTSTMISFILREAGYRTGLFISPFVLDFRERIQLNNEMISKNELLVSLGRVKPHWDALEAIGQPPTEFEVVTALAMDFYSRMDCGIVVLEVGLGGRFDATNIIKTPLCSVITAIDLDHTKILGDAIPQIAYEKCGIIKENGITVTSYGQHPEALDVIKNTCVERSNRLFVAGEPEILSMDIHGSRIRYDGTKSSDDGLEVFVPLCGKHQTINAATAIEAVKASGLKVSDDAVAKGIAKTRFPARFEILSERPLVILDGAHNPSKARALAEALNLLPAGPIHAVVAAMADKDVDGMLAAILPLCKSVTAVTVRAVRALDADSIARLAQKYCDRVYTADSLNDAVNNALRLAGRQTRRNGSVLIFGSLYLAAEARPVVYAELGAPTKSDTYESR